MENDIVFFRAWNVIATDGKIWRNWFLYVYGTSNLREDLMTAAEIREDIIPDSNRPTILKKPSNNAVGYWRKAFNLCSKGILYQSLEEAIFGAVNI